MRVIGAYFCYVKNSYEILIKPKADTNQMGRLPQLVVASIETIDDER